MSYTSYKRSRELWEAAFFKTTGASLLIYVDGDIRQWVPGIDVIKAANNNLCYVCYNAGQLIREIGLLAHWLHIQFDGGAYNLSCLSNDYTIETVSKSLAEDAEKYQFEATADTLEDAAGMLLIKLLK